MVGLSDRRAPASGYAIAPVSRRHALTALTLSPALFWPGLLLAKGYPLRVDRVRFLGLAAAPASGALAVGERGVIARLPAGANGWTLQRLATRESLTACALRDDGLALAVGHGGAAFRSEDSGASWQPLASALDPVNPNRDPWLSVFVGRRGGLWLMGGFGLLAYSEDGAKTWVRLTPMEPDFDRHLYGMAEILEGGFLLLGESGSLAESFDGREWKERVSPYDGSWFGGLQTAAGSLLAFGMRGQIFRRAGGQSQWTAAEGPSVTHGWVHGAQLQNGQVVLVGGQGMAAVSGDDGRRFELKRLWDGHLSGICQDARERVWISGTQGIRGFDSQWRPLT
ncbi:MAG: hypothetical protein RLY30_1807 [Pseudomonadota bacterium]